MNSQFNELILVASDEGGKEKKKKGDGVNAVLTLMKDMRDFQEKVESCIESQDIDENKQKVVEFNTHIENMYEVLLDIARGGIKRDRAVNQPPQVQEVMPEVVTEPKDEFKLTAPKAPKI